MGSLEKKPIVVVVDVSRPVVSWSENETMVGIEFASVEDSQS